MIAKCEENMTARGRGRPAEVDLLKQHVVNVIHVQAFVKRPCPSSLYHALFLPMLTFTVPKNHAAASALKTATKIVMGLRKPAEKG